MARQYKLLEVENLNTSFKIDAGRVLSVNGVSFTLEKGEVLGIVGESGSGKSVTAYSIMGILDKNGTVDSGKIIYNGTDLCKISEKEMRQLRGNRISIIFQDAMTSLNPTWTIGNQLREAILTHAMNPLQKDIQDLENAITSDHQRIAAIQRGIGNHPERAYLKTALVEVQAKLEQDKADLAEKKKQYPVEYGKLKKTALAKYKAAVPDLNQQIKSSLNAYVTRFFSLNPAPSVEEAGSQPSALRLAKELALKQASYDEQKAKVDSLAIGEGEDPVAFRKGVSNEKKILQGLAKEVKDAEKALKADIRAYQRKVRLAPRKARGKFFRNALANKRNFKQECIASYRENKYSANQKALKMLEEVGITEPEKRMKQYPFELSGGMLQRCMIAMALVERPDILIADEPTTALDVTIQAQILDLLKRLQKEYGMAIVIITHDLGVVAQICDKVNIMYAGRIVERGSVDDIFYNPQHEYTKGLLKSMPRLDSKGERLEPIQGNPVDLFCLPKGCAFSSRCKQCMELCIERYPEEVSVDGSEHRASCWKVVKALQEQGLIDAVNGEPEGKPLNYNGAIIAKEKNRRVKHGKDN